MKEPNIVKKIIESTQLEKFILYVILFNSILMGFMTNRTLMATEPWGGILNFLNNLCLMIFILELLAKLFVYRLSFFKEGWNIFDFTIVTLCLVPTGGIFSSFRMLRTFRVFRSFRALRMVTKLGKLRLIVQAIIESIPNIAWTSLLLGIIYYIYAIAGTELFRDAFPEWFGSLSQTLYTLFQIMTLESWSMGISRPVMEVYPWASLYFISFILFTAFIVLNVVIGVVVNTISDLANQEKLDRMEASCDEPTLLLYQQYLSLKAEMELFEQAFEISIKNQKDEV
ncbi:MAG: ion transporter [Bacillota bacterium]